MSKTLRLERTATYVVWQEIEVPDDFDTSDEVAMVEMITAMPYPADSDSDPRNGRAEVTQRVVWEGGRICYFASLAE